MSEEELTCKPGYTLFRPNPVNDKNMVRKEEPGSEPYCKKDNYVKEPTKDWKDWGGWTADKYYGNKNKKKKPPAPCEAGYKLIVDHSRDGAHSEIRPLFECRWKGDLYMEPEPIKPKAR